MKISGVYTALVTPFRGGRFDAEAYRSHIAAQLAAGVSGLVPCGTTGEAVTLSVDEHREVIATCVQAVRGRAKVIAGAGTNSTADTVAAVARARDAGADAAMIVTPYYNKPTAAGVVAHCRAIAAAHPGFPLVVYNVPSRTGVDFGVDGISALADVAEVVAVKEATGSMQRILELKEVCGDRFSWLSGDDFTLLPFLACGGDGVISVASNVAPALVVEIVEAVSAGRRAQALEAQQRLQPLNRALFLESNPIPVKWAMQELGFCSAELRLPLTTLSPPHRGRVADAVRAAVLDSSAKGVQR